MSIFADDWRECLREQYKHVVRQQDHITRRSLIAVLHSVGFTEADLRALEIEATMRADDMPDDFVPDFDSYPEEPAPAIDEVEMFQPHPLECQCPACVEMNLRPHDAEGQPLLVEDDDQDAPTQLSMF